MGKEIERKFLIDLSLVGKMGTGISIQQAYIPTTNKTVVRARVAGEKAYITLKGETTGFSRSEFEYEIPVDDAKSVILELCSGPSIEKTRYMIEYGDHVWEIDIFHGENDGLVVAEVEMGSEDETVKLPRWVVEEVTGQSKYYNSNLLRNPFKMWDQM